MSGGTGGDESGEPGASRSEKHTTGHVDEAYVQGVEPVLCDLCQINEKELSVDICFHNTTKRVCLSMDGTFSLQTLTRVGRLEALQLWFGEENKS